MAYDLEVQDNYALLPLAFCLFVCQCFITASESEMEQYRGSHITKHAH